MLHARFLALLGACCAVFLGAAFHQSSYAQEVLARLVPQTGHARFVSSVSASSDSRFAVTGGWDGTLRLWDFDTGTEIRKLVGDDAAAQKASATGLDIVYGEFAPSGHRILFSTDDSFGVIDLDVPSKGFTKSRVRTGRVVRFILGGRKVRVCDGGVVETFDAQSGASEGSQMLPGAFDPASWHFDTICEPSRDGRYVFVGKSPSAVEGPAVKIWNVTTQTFESAYLGPPGVREIDIAPSGTRFLATGSDGAVYVWAVGKPTPLWTKGNARLKNPVVGDTRAIGARFLGSDDSVALMTSAVDWVFEGTGTFTGNNSLVKWDLTRDELMRAAPHPGIYPSPVMQFSNGQLLSVANDKWIDVWNVEKWERERSFKGNALGAIKRVQVSDDEKLALVSYNVGSAVLIDLESGGIVRELTGRQGEQLLLSTDGRYLANDTRIEDARSGVLISSPKWLSAVSFRKGSSEVVARGFDDKVVIVDVLSGQPTAAIPIDPVDPDDFAALPANARLVSSFPRNKVYGVTPAASSASAPEAAHADVLYKEVEAQEVALSPDGNVLATAAIREDPAGKYDMSIRLWNAKSGHLIRKIRRDKGWVQTLSFSRDGARLLVGGGAVEVWRVSDGVRTGFWEKADDGTWLGFNCSARFLPGESEILATYDNGLVRRLSEVSGRRVVTMSERHLGAAEDAAYLSKRGLIASVGDDAVLRIFKASDGSQLVRYMALGKSDWSVIDSAGRFDSGSEATTSFVWVFKDRVYTLDQLRDLYYEPNLLSKYLGTNPDPLTAVPGFDRPQIYPDVVISQLKREGSFKVVVTDQGSGIGRVPIMINGRELADDLRATPENKGRKVVNGQLELSVDVKGDRRVRGESSTNDLVVRAYDATNSVSTRGNESKFIGFGTETADADPPRLFGVVVGVSDYRAESLHLSYAAKDAEDFGNALKLAAQGLLGADRAKVTVLSSKQAAQENRPTRANILAALSSLRNVARKDIVVVYFAGHGTAHSPNGDYYFLSSSAASLDLERGTDRDRDAISATELANILREIPAEKRVVIMDSCGAGQVIDKFTKARAMPSDQVRAIEGLNRRTGFHILAGAAADKSSYESGRFSQGLLTFSLLQGMHGAALRDGDVDVVTLFEYSREQVPVLAAGIGGIQRPIYASPEKGGSFAIGRLDAQAMKRIPVQEMRPVFVQSSLVDGTSFNDRLLALSKAADDAAEQLAEPDPLTGRSSVVFVSGDTYPDAFQIAGSYSINGDGVRATLTLRDGAGKEIDRRVAEGARSQIALLVTARAKELVLRVIKDKPSR